MNNKLPTEWNLLNNIWHIINQQIEKEILLSSDVQDEIEKHIESHTAARTAELREENTRYRQALESIATRWNKVAEHNDMRTALHLIQQDVFEALKQEEQP